MELPGCFMTLQGNFYVYDTLDGVAGMFPDFPGFRHALHTHIPSRMTAAFEKLIELGSLHDRLGQQDTRK